MKHMSNDARGHRFSAAILFASAAALGLWSSPAASADPEDPAPAAPGSDSGDKDPQRAGAEAFSRGLTGIAKQFMDGSDDDSGPQVLDPATGNMSSNIDPQTGLPKGDGPHKGNPKLDQAINGVLDSVQGQGLGAVPGEGDSPIPPAANDLLNNVIGAVGNNDKVQDIINTGKSLLGGDQDSSDAPPSDGPDDGN